jgi:adenylate cyclase
MRGYWHAWHTSREDFAIAVPLFLDAIELDPGFARPHGGLAMVRMWEGLFHWSDNPAQAFAAGLANARTALALDPLDSGAHSTLGMLLASTGKLDESGLASRRAIELNPSNVTGYAGLAWAQHLRGEPEPGIRAIETAIRLSPSELSLHALVSLHAALLYVARDYAKAAEVAQFVVQCAPQYPIGWRGLASALGQLGRLDEAREALAQLLRLSPGLSTEQAMRSSLPIRDETVFQHYLEGLRKAGWTG